MGVGMTGVVVWKLMLVGVCFGCNGLVFAHYRPLDMCDFYFRGHKEIAPMLDVLATKNVTSSPPVLTKLVAMSFPQPPFFGEQKKKTQKLDLQAVALQQLQFA